MKLIPCIIALTISLFVPQLSQALITGAEGNEEVENRGWPAGSEKVANLKTRIAWWEGPPFGGGQYTFEFHGESTADFNQALEQFSKIESPKKELIVQSGPKNSFWLGIGDRKEKAAELQMDWAFVVWNADSWKQLFNDPDSTFMSDSPNYRKPVDPPRLVLYAGGGSVVWEEVVVPDGVTVIDRRAKDGVSASVTGKVTDIVSGGPIEGVKITLKPGSQKVQGELPHSTTDADGHYVLKGVQKGGYYVVASKDGYATKRSLSYSEIQGVDVREEDFALSKAVEISGHIRGPEGEILGGARVIATNVIGTDKFGYNAVENPEVRSDEEGVFKLSGLPEGECRLLVWLDGYYNPRSVRTSYELPGNGPIIINMIRTGTIRGTLKRSGKGQLHVRIHPPGGNVVGSWGGGMNCKEDGSFEFKNVPVGEYLLGPSGVEDMEEGDPGVEIVTVQAGKTETVALEE